MHAGPIIKNAELIGRAPPGTSRKALVIYIDNLVSYLRDGRAIRAA